MVSANAAMLASGIGMYLMFSLLTRYFQTPAAADYGFGLSGLLAGAALIPFSVFGFVAGRWTPHVSARLTTSWTFAAHAMTVIIASVLFVIAPESIIATLVSMSILGFGVGGISAIMPNLVLEGIPPEETSSILSINQIVRSVGFSIGSALAGLLLGIATPAGTMLPTESGYKLAAVCVLPLLIISSLSVVLVRRK